MKDLICNAVKDVLDHWSFVQIGTIDKALPECLEEWPDNDCDFFCSAVYEAMTAADKRIFSAAVMLKAVDLEINPFEDDAIFELREKILYNLIIGGNLDLIEAAYDRFICERQEQREESAAVFNLDYAERARF